MTTVDIELAIMFEFDYRRNLIVPGITNMMNIVAFETDMLVINQNGYATGFEIKVSKSDLKADLKKKHIQEMDTFRNGKSGLERFYGKFKFFYYAVPKHLVSDALEIIPYFCGVYSCEEVIMPTRTKYILKEERKPKKLFDFIWDDKAKYGVARLGAMRIYKLKHKLRHG